MGIEKFLESTINMFLRLLLVFSLFSIPDIASAQNYYPRSEYSVLHPSSCDSSSCYPATGNLLIGREKNLVASSTCGLRKRERFCIMSHLTEKKKCFWCDSTPKYRHDPRISHTIDNVVYRVHPGTQTKSWWQAENGKENVTIQLNMEAEFQFTHMMITFKTFRPKAAIVERSYDFGLTWQIYRYFAYNCKETFPYVYAGPPRNLTDIVCESRYSGIAPSQDGEFIFRVLPQHFEINDPYSEEVQNLLKMTNLRINFTKLHTLGDDFLDQREEIQEKYYYAITDMIVRGSCSCYGHASQCLPAEGEQDIPDMIHGQCNCTHNTQGNNCEKCKDFYNDLPWKPAIGKATNACKRCNCNEHAFVCHFDEAVYEQSGRVSGGVCEGCMHNTTGRNCELCRDFFYQNPERDLTDPDICEPCDCDPRGSLDEGICDSRSDEINGLVAGRCHCKENVDGRRCDYCKNGFWNFSESNPQGCEACTCNTLGTVNNQGCDVYTGVCTCKRAVEGRDCDQCMVEHWGLSEDQDGCKPCGCNLGGSLDNNCDINTGQCRCLPHAAGTTCELPEQGFYVGLPDYLLYEAEYARISDDAKVVTREPPEPGYGVKTWTGPGFVRVYMNSELDFDVDRIYRSMDYDIHIRYEPQGQFPYGWEDVRVIVERDGPVDEGGPCANAVFEDDLKNVSLPGNTNTVLVQPKVCLETGRKYNIKIIFKHYSRYDDKPTASILIDSIVLVPRIDRLPIIPDEPSELWDPREFDANRCADIIYSTDKKNIPEACKKYYYSIGFWTFGGAHACECDQTGSTSLICDTLAGQCSCKKNVGGRRCDSCVPGTYGFGPQGCRACDCNAIGSYDNTCERESGQCKCKPNTYGRMCDECQPGFWNFPNCIRCECNGHADICDSKTGKCISCRDNTTGDRCDECKVGYYGDPRLGVDIPCRSCPCPGSQESGHSFAKTCALDPESNNVVCDCAPEYAGRHCDVCADNYYGNPEVPGGSCQACECSNNIDITAPGNCDANTGECRKCLFNTEGFHCEICKDGFYGNATGQLCNECVCDFLGTDQKAGVCDKETGQCSCLPNVVGLTCDSCQVNHWKIASGEGCEACGCDSVGSYKEQCNLYDGQCDCKPGFGGRRCDQCQANFWGDPNVECHECECYPEGAATSQCHQNNGSCVCLQGIGGYKCDQCARGYVGSVPHCSPCGECFNNWDRILGQLSERTAQVVKAASEINETGITGPYSHQYEIMAQHLEDVQKILNDTTSSEKQIQSLQNTIDSVRNDVSSTGTQLSEVEATSNKILQNVLQLNLTLIDLEKRLDKLRADSQTLNNNATVLQESDIEGALQLTRTAAERADAAWREAELAKSKAEAAEKLCKRTEKSMENADERNQQTQDENARALDNVGERLKKLEEELPNINDQVCNGRNLRDEYVNFCSPVCGGGGCGQCGGYSCEGAVDKAKKAVKYAQDTDEELKPKDASAEQLLREVIQVSEDTSKAHMDAENALKDVQNVTNTSKRFLQDAESLVDRIKEFVNNTPATPEDIQKKASETLNILINLDPNDIDDLAKKINDTIGSLTNIEDILDETKKDQQLSKDLKSEALDAKARADDILKRSENIVNALNNTKKAQKEAAVAIDKANNDTNAAGKDLAQITSETEDAYTKTNKTVTEVEAFQARLNKLNSALIKNQGEVKELSDAADGVAAQGETVRKNVAQLRKEYDAAVDKVDQDYDQTGDTKRQADQLLKKASELSYNTKTKLDQLKDMERLYQSHENELDNLTSRINELTERMGEYLNYIIERSVYYQTCTS